MIATCVPGVFCRTKLSTLYIPMEQCLASGCRLSIWYPHSVCFSRESKALMIVQSYQNLSDSLLILVAPGDIAWRTRRKWWSMCRTRCFGPELHLYSIQKTQKPVMWRQKRRVERRCMRTTHVCREEYVLLPAATWLGLRGRPTISCITLGWFISTMSGKMWDSFLSSHILLVKLIFWYPKDIL